MQTVTSPPVLVVMGVAGSGKSTVATGLGQQLGWPVEEGDTLHPAANVARMHAGTALTDADRWPWLAKVADWIDACLAAGRPGVVTCSALKRTYRDRLRRPSVVFVYLRVPRDVLTARLRARHGHFMPASLLDSQLTDLEPPGRDERAITVDGAADAETIAAEIIDALEALGLPAASGSGGGPGRG